MAARAPRNPTTRESRETPLAFDTMTRTLARMAILSRSWRGAHRCGGLAELSASVNLVPTEMGLLYAHQRRHPDQRRGDVVLAIAALIRPPSAASPSRREPQGASAPAAERAGAALARRTTTSTSTAAVICRAARGRGGARATPSRAAGRRPLHRRRRQIRDLFRRRDRGRDRGRRPAASPRWSDFKAYLAERKR